ncbi:hypothetical protein TRICHSKD4_3075 [Roseibium sp. TrichSKD4]|nr:hypothetical protein TRICHSKD4_3075 [Roseibium sp. TrichSKD4]
MSNRIDTPSSEIITGTSFGSWILADEVDADMKRSKFSMAQLL